MFAIISNNAIAMFVAPGTPFTWDGQQYAANWCNLSTPEEKAAIGMVDVVYGAQPSDQYYWVSQDAPVYNGTVVEINYTATPKDFAECQKQAVSAVYAQAYSILLPSDWMAVKAFETAVAMPQAWMDWRQAIRVQASDRRDVIMACTTVDQLAALPSVQWAHDPNYIAPTEA